MTNICLIDDDQNILASLSLTLKSEGYNIKTFSDGLSGLTSLQEDNYDIAILDIKMPRLDGLEVLQELRQTSNLPVIFLTSKDEEIDQLLGLKMGADDYITKPVKIKVLVSKVKSLLRRLQDGPDSDSLIEVGSLVVNREEYKIIYNGEEKILPRKEFELLSLLASKPNKVFEREVILDRVWGNEVIVGGRTIDVHIRKLREKIGDQHFKTVKGVGYKYVI